ncbi:LpqN/LpqT family lipoprotein [Cellulosimicrobium cellulans]|uniref:LpqN/LpqT family lipoprotein n=1 Tax=Cellulosimicrobium cellulans TaxID=1710 RepID=UPI0019644FB4|nr:LpqN/LpqT family lipoprotein [Cellulosimicrobium cellulans]MBN0041913.1 LpqN/LpqT family lipoprotein [Cellulosimicrobium cellulans]
MPRPRHPRPLWHLATLATAALALAGCGGGPAGAGADDAPVAYDVPEVPVRVTAPPGWERATRDGAFVLHAPGGSGGFRANVVVTGTQSAATLEEAGARTAAAVDAIPGWGLDADGQGTTTLGELPAFRVAGTYETAGTVVVQEILAVRTGDAPDDWVVDLTASYADGDADGAAQTRAILESVELAPAG